LSKNLDTIKVSKTNDNKNNTTNNNRTKYKIMPTLRKLYTSSDNHIEETIPEYNLVSSPIYNGYNLNSNNSTSTTINNGMCDNTITDNIQPLSGNSPYSPYSSTNTIEKEDLFIIFYINIDGMSRRISEEKLAQLNNIYTFDNIKNYNVEKIIIPVKNQPTKMEIINPKISNTDVIESFKEIVKLIDDEKLNEIIEKLKK